MKRLIFVLVIVCASCSCLFAQEESVTIPPQVDSSLVGVGLYSYIPFSVELRQSSAIHDSFLALVQGNADAAIFPGFRIRLYQSSAQEARAESEKVLEAFSEDFPEIPAGISYDSPYFKVTAGGYRTRVEAEKMLRRVRASFPTASVIKEKIKYPLL